MGSKECLSRREVAEKLGVSLSLVGPDEITGKQECGQIFGADTDYLDMTSIIKPEETVYECLPSERIIKQGEAYKPYPVDSIALQSIFSRYLTTNPDALSIIRFGYGLNNTKANKFYEVNMREASAMAISFKTTLSAGRLRITFSNVNDPIFKTVTLNFEYDRSSLGFNIVGLSYTLVNGTPQTELTHFLNSVNNKLKSNWFNLWTAVFSEPTNPPLFVFEIQYPIL